MQKKPQNSSIIRYWLACAIAATVVFAVTVPGPARYLPRLGIIDGGVVIIMFIGSLKLSLSRFIKAIRRPDIIILCLISTYILAPLFSIGIGSITGLSSPEDRLAILISSAQASTLATAIVLTEIAGGNVALAMVLTITNNLLSVFMTPLVFRILGGTEIEVDYISMSLQIALKIAAPVIAAQIARIWLSRWASRHSRSLSLTSQFIILVYIYAGVSAGAQTLAGTGQILINVLLLVLLLHPVLLAANALIMRLVSKDPGTRTAFVLCSSQKTLPVAVMIWKNFFPALPLGPLVAVGYHMLQLIVDSIIAPGFRRLPLIRN